MAGRRVAASVRPVWVRKLLAIALFVAISVWAAAAVLPTESPPELEEPPVIGAAVPQAPLHDSGTGYVMSVRLAVEACDKPVRGEAWLTLPREFFDAQPRPRIRRALLALGFTASDATVTNVELWDFGPKRPATPSWSWILSESDDQTAFQMVGGAWVAAARIDGWRPSQTTVHVTFDASWLHPRSYRSCWLSLPELVGPQQGRITYAVGEAINETLGPKSGADVAADSETSVEVTATLLQPDGRWQTTHESDTDGPEYVDSLSLATAGVVSVDSELDIDAEASNLPTMGSFHDAVWACRGKELSPYAGAGAVMSGLTEDGYSALSRATTEELLPPQTRRGCAGWIALVRPGTQTWWDIWVLVLGAALSIAAALAVELAVSSRSNS